jgi:hypothetical protein
MIDADAANAPDWSQILRICWAFRPLGVNIGSAGLINCSLQGRIGEKIRGRGG